MNWAEFKDPVYHGSILVSNTRDGRFEPFYCNLKTFKDSFYSSEKHFLFDNCGFWVCEIKVFLWNLAFVSDGN